MKRTFLRALVVLSVLAAFVAPYPAAGQRAVAVEPVTIPFELATRHIIVNVTINNSRPLSFVLDTGAHAALVRMDVAKELGLKLEGELNVGGAGPGIQKGRYVSGATWSLVGLPGFSQPVTFALPMPELPVALGRPIDGIIGGEFIRQFVLELDYQAQRIRLHDPASFTYKGGGEAVPIEFVSGTHPTFAAMVTPVGGKPIERRFLFDIGSGQALVLHSPFVNEQKLPGPDMKTIRAIGRAGAGGKTAGQVGRVESLRIGSSTIASPITMFSQDKAGAFANAAQAGNIGAQIAMRFRLFFDYGRRRIIFEPTASLAAPFDRAHSGLALRAFGADFREFRVTDVLDNSPATEAGLQEGDIITSIDDVPAAQLTLSMINEMFEKPVRYSVKIRRGGQILTLALTPRRMI